MNVTYDKQWSLTVPYVVIHILNEGLDDRTGKIERLEQQVEKLASIVGELIERSSDPIGFLNEVSYNEWREVE